MQISRNIVVASLFDSFCPRFPMKPLSLTDEKLAHYAICGVPLLACLLAMLACRPWILVLACRLYLP